MSADTHPTGMRVHTAGSGRVVSLAPGYWRLGLEAGSARTYHLAQLDDYGGLPRSKFPNRPPWQITLQARVSQANLAGTWGFGLWNDPFGFSLGFGGAPWRLPTLPQATWFFHASRENFLSFRDAMPANGFLAQVFRSRFRWDVLRAMAAYPFSPSRARQLLAGCIEEAARELACDVTEWHTYRMRWLEDQVHFEVDGESVFSAPFSPVPPLGLVIWIDNQFAAFPPDGGLRAGVLPIAARCWMEVILR